MALSGASIGVKSSLDSSATPPPEGLSAPLLSQDGAPLSPLRAAAVLGVQGVAELTLPALAGGCDIERPLLPGMGLGTSAERTCRRWWGGRGRGSGRVGACVCVCVGEGGGQRWRH